MPHKTAICAVSDSGAVTWILYRNGTADFPSDGTRPDLTFDMAGWKP